MEWGGSNIRPEATGYGAVYFGDEILKEQGDSFKVRGTAVVRVNGCDGQGCSEKGSKQVGWKPGQGGAVNGSKFSR